MTVEVLLAAWKWLDNSSVAAFFGALFAFLLVTLNDWRRRLKSKQQIHYLVGDNLDHAQSKLRTVQVNLEMLAENRFVPAPVMRFSVAPLRAKQLEVIDLLDSNQNRSLDALIYWMEAIDGVLEDYRETAVELRRCVEENADNATRSRLGERMRTDLSDAARNLELFARLAESFVSRRYHEILEFQHPVGGDRGT